MVKVVSFPKICFQNFFNFLGGYTTLLGWGTWFLFQLLESIVHLKKTFSQLTIISINWVLFSLLIVSERKLCTSQVVKKLQWNIWEYGKLPSSVETSFCNLKWQKILEVFSNLFSKCKALANSLIFYHSISKRLND